MRKIDRVARMKELDAQPFTKFTAGYAPEVQQWWDGYGPSNWGATCQDTSAYVGIDAVRGLAAGDDSKRVILPGGLGCITHKLVEVLQPNTRNACSATRPSSPSCSEKDAVNVTYSHEGQLTTVAAKAVLMCTPKHITSRLVRDLPVEQRTAMHRTRFAPYPVVNVIFDKPVYNRGYDNWCPGNTFTDFIVADWTVRNQPGYKQKNNILSFYTPLREVSARHAPRRRRMQNSRRPRPRRFPKIDAGVQRRSDRSPHLSPRPSHVHGRSRPVHEKSHRRRAADGPRLSSATPIPAALNRSPAKPCASQKSAPNGSILFWQESPARRHWSRKLWHQRAKR